MYDWLIVGAGITGCVLAERLAGAGRLGTYAYLNMDQAVGQALAVFEKIQKGE